MRKENADNKLIISQLTAQIEKKEKEKELKEIIHSLQTEIDTMEKQRKKSITTISFWIIFTLDILLLVALVFFGIILGKSYLDGAAFTLDLKTILAAISLLGFLFRVRDAYWLKPFIKYSQCKNEQTKYWEGQHPEYAETKTQLAEAKKELHLLRIRG